MKYVIILPILQIEKLRLTRLVLAETLAQWCLRQPHFSLKG